MKRPLTKNELLYRALEQFIAELPREEYLRREAAFKEVQTAIHMKMQEPDAE